MKEEGRQGQRILVVDDDLATLKLVAKALEFEGYRVQTVDSGQAALTQMRDYLPHLVLLDVSMPDLNGLETLKLLRSADEYVATVFVSAKSDTEDVIKGLDAGAGDYICKPFEVKELLARVRSQLRIKDLHDRLKVANEKLKELVDIDDLTGLFNMRSLYKKLDFEIDRAERHGRSVCVMMMDMDHFKRTNDENDHLFGSYVLGQVGKLIRDNMRKIDFAARYGGDEFLIVLTEIDEPGARVFAERLREAILETTFSNGEYKINLTSSIGFAISRPGRDHLDGRSLVKRADKALYRAKNRGRNRCEFFSPEEDLPTE